jgi:hypothetical protein
MVIEKRVVSQFDTLFLKMLNQSRKGDFMGKNNTSQLDTIGEAKQKMRLLLKTKTNSEFISMMSKMCSWWIDCNKTIESTPQVVHCK